MSALAAATKVTGVTCVVPAFNASNTIDACLASLLAHYHEEVEGFRHNFGASVNEALGAPLLARTGAVAPP